MKLAIVVVTYNAKKWLPLSLGSCLKYASQVPLYAVDNNSGDGTPAAIKRSYPAVHLIRSAVNAGFAGGNNLGIRQALADGAEGIMLLNQDAALTAGTLDGLVAELDSKPSLAAVQPVILLPDGQVNSIGNFFHYLGLAEAGGNGLALAKAWRKIYKNGQAVEPAYFSGAAVLLRATALKQVGLFDEDLFMYHEDLELSLRFRLKSWQIGLAKNSTVVHHYSEERSKSQIYFMERNRYLVWLSYFKPATWAVLFLPALLAELAMFFLSLVNGWVMAKLRAWDYLLSPAGRGYLSGKRRQLKAFKPYRDRTLLTFAVSELNWQGDIWYMKIFNLAGNLYWHLIFPWLRW